ncbi:MAG: hypothetical protein J7K20_05355, partial [Thermodesulfobacterium sp.]|nr:hypothetical protein [Thermodesulfobacterium sp.]
MRDKKLYIYLFLSSLILIFISVFSVKVKVSHTISGPCSDCHTMHNSQNGQTVVSGGAYRALTTGDCVICHTGTNNGTNNIPYVNSESAPTYNFGGERNTLAGGNFYWVTQDDTYGHNVNGVITPDPNLSVPPGYLADYRDGMTWSSGQPVTCAGNYGCHGKFESGNTTLNDPFAAISGAHHKNVNRDCGTAAPTDVYDSYRFLYGIKGIEDSDREYTLSTTNHNGYYAVDQSPTPGTNSGSINYLCAECHGQFHNGTFSSNYQSPWLRHPTDYDMNNVSGKEYGNYPNTSIFSGKLDVTNT